MEETPKPKSRRNKLIGWAVILLLVGLYIWWVEDWYQLWKIASAPDNVPIVGMLFLVPFFTWLGVRQAVANDQLINRLEADPKLAKTHHRKAEPWRPGWAKDACTGLSRAIGSRRVRTVILMSGRSPERAAREPANPNLTMNRRKRSGIASVAEMLVYFDRGSRVW